MHMILDRILVSLWSNGGNPVQFTDWENRGAERIVEERSGRDGKKERDRETAKTVIKFNFKFFKH